MAGAFAKTKKATNILRPAIDVTFDKDAESEVFFEVWVPEVSATILIRRQLSPSCWRTLLLGVMPSTSRKQVTGAPSAGTYKEPLELVAIFKIITLRLQERVPFRVRVHTITLSVHLNGPFRLQALAGTRIQRAALLTSAQ